MKDLCIIPENKIQYQKILAFLLKNNIEYQDADEYLEENAPECECEEEEPELLTDVMKEELWERIKDQYTVDQLEEILEKH